MQQLQPSLSMLMLSLRNTEFVGVLSQELVLTTQMQTLGNIIQSKVEFWKKSQRLSLQVAPAIYIMLHNAAGKGASAFGDVTGFDIEDHCVDLFYWFDKFTKRKGAKKV